MDWKNRLERTVGLNTAVVKAAQSDFLNKKVIEDLEHKNKTLHKCTYYAHNALSVILNFTETEWDEKCLYTEIENIKKKMEAILEEGSNEAVSSKPSIVV